MDTSIARTIDGLIASAESIRAQLRSLMGGRRSSQTGVRVLAKFVIPAGYKRLSGRVGNLWLDSSFTAQVEKLAQSERAWALQVLDFLGTVKTLSSGGQRTQSPRGLQVKFSATQHYSRLLSRLDNGVRLLQELKLREVVTATSTVEVRGGTERLRWVGSMTEIWFDGDLEARKGDIVRVTRGIPDGPALRATVVQNLTAGHDQRSRVEGTLMIVTPADLEQPMVGRVEKLHRHDGNTYITLSTGVYEAPNLFFPAGDFQAGQDALRRILRTDVRGYLKVADPYVSPATLRLLESAPVGTVVQLLCRKPDDLAEMKAKVGELTSKGYAVKIRLGKKDEMHGRYLITDGAEWMIDHSLKDFGTRDCAAARLAPPVHELEALFDRRWSLAQDY